MKTRLNRIISILHIFISAKGEAFISSLKKCCWWPSYCQLLVTDVYAKFRKLFRRFIAIRNFSFGLCVLVHLAICKLILFHSEGKNLILYFTLSQEYICHWLLEFEQTISQNGMDQSKYKKIIYLCRRRIYG